MIAIIKNATSGKTVAKVIQLIAEAPLFKVTVKWFPPYVIAESTTVDINSCKNRINKKFLLVRSSLKLPFFTLTSSPSSFFPSSLGKPKEIEKAKINKTAYVANIAPSRPKRSAKNPTAIPASIYPNEPIPLIEP